MNSRKRTFIGSLLVLSVLGTGGAAAEPFVYVTQFAGTSVTVIDAATSSIVATIPVQPGPQDVALSPDGSMAYVANTFANSVSVIDTATNSVVATIPGVLSPASIVVTPDGTRAFAGGEVGIDEITVIYLGSNTLGGTISTAPGGDITLAMDFLPDGSRLYAAPLNLDSVFSIDMSTHSVTGTPLLLDPAGQVLDLVVTGDGTRAYLSRQVAGSGRVTVIDIASNSQVHEISVGSMPWGLALGTDGTRLYVTSGGAGTVSVIDTATNQVIGAPIDVGGSPRRLAVTPDGARLFVTNNGNDTVSIIDLATNSVVDTLDVPGLPYGIAIGPGLPVATMAVDPANPLAVYAGTAGAGVYRTLNGGTTWTAINTGITDPDIVALVIASDGSAIYAGTREGGVFRSTDGGANWTPVNNGLDPRILSLEIVPGDGMTLYASVDGGGGVYKTTDGGATWTAVNDGLPIGSP